MDLCVPLLGVPTGRVEAVSLTIVSAGSIAGESGAVACTPAGSAGVSAGFSDEEPQAVSTKAATTNAAAKIFFMIFWGLVLSIQKNYNG